MKRTAIFPGLAQRKPGLLRRSLYLLVGLALPALIYLALRTLPLAEIWAILLGMQLWQIAALIAANLLITLLLSSRWWLILRAGGYRVPYLTLAGYRLAGFAISYFTPGTQFGGEPLQVYLLEKRQAVPTEAALASVTLDKLFELLVNFTFLVTGILFLLQSGLLAGLAEPRSLLWSSSLLALPLLYLLALLVRRFPLTWLVLRLPSQWMNRPSGKKIVLLVTSSEQQISSLFRQQPMMMLWVLFISGATWVLVIAEYWLTLSFLGAHLDLFQTISALTATRLAFLTPIPGGLGALEAGQVLVLRAFGFSPALGLSLSLLIRLRDTSLGLLGLWWGAVLARRVQGFSPASQRLK